MAAVAPNADVLGRLMVVQSTLHVMPDTGGAAELVSQGLSRIPGVRAVALCLGRTLAGESEGFDSRHLGTANAGACPLGGACSWQGPDAGSTIGVRTVNRQFGCLVFDLASADEFAVYRPYAQNAANTLAMTIENREQKERLESLNRDLRNEITEKTRAQEALLQIQHHLEDTVAQRTTELRRVNAALETEVRDRKLAQETSAWEAAVNGAVARLAQSMLQAVNLDQIASVVLDEAVRLTESRHGCVGHLNEQGRLVCPAREGGAGPAEPASADVGDGPWNWVLRERKPLLVNEPSSPDPRIPSSPAQARRFLSVPAVAGGEVVGQITVLGAPRDYTRHDGELLERLAESYALAVQRHRDTAERRRLEGQIQRAQKLESVGVLAGGIAHDFRNLLQIIRAYVDLLLRGADEDSPSRRFLEELAQAVERGAEITARLLAFSRKGDIKAQRLDLNQVVRDVARILEHTLPKMIRVDLRLAADAGGVDGDQGQLAQVLINLAVNARDAMAEGGTLEIVTERTAVGREEAAARAGLAPGEYATVRVRDTGIGMDEATLRRIFDPFFTTKEVGQGTGLGLAVAYGIVKAHHGHIACASEPGVGSTFSILLPLAAGQATQTPKPTGETAPPKAGKETVLLVDDEAAILAALDAVLSANGYRTLRASDGKEALVTYRTQGNAIDLVVMDLGIPGAGGEACIREIRRLNRNARVIVSTGSVWPGWAEAGAAACLTKPYPLSQLLSTVRKVLDATDTGPAKAAP